MKRSGRQQRRILKDASEFLPEGNVMKLWLIGAAMGLAMWPASSGYAGRLEVTPFAGYQFGGRFEITETGTTAKLSDASCWGGILGVGLTESTELEFYYSRQETELTADDLFPQETLFDLDVEYFHLGGNYIFSQGTWRPFIGATLGVTHLSPEPSAIDSMNRFSLGLGGGVRFFPMERLGLYLACRGLVTFVESSTRISSGPEEGGTIEFSGDGFWQFQLGAGLIFAF